MKSQAFEFESNNKKCFGTVFHPKDESLGTVVIVPGGSGLLSLPAKGLTLNEDNCSKIDDNFHKKLAKTNKYDEQLGIIVEHYDQGRGLYELGRAFSQYRLTSIVYDGRGQGKSEGLLYSQNTVIEDLTELLDFLISSDFIDSDKIALFGQCTGGAAAIQVTSRRKEIRCISVYGTIPDYVKALTDNRFSKAGKKSYEKFLASAKREGESIDIDENEYLKKYALLKPIEDIRKVCQPVLIAGGTLDENNTIGEQEQLFSAAVNSRSSMFLRISGQPHRLLPDHPSFYQAVKIFSTWMKCHI